MISYDRDPQQTIPESSVKILGLGGAGANMLDRATLDGMTGPEMLCVNTDIRTLSSSVAGEKIQIGKNLTKGLGAGGDPELGYKAAQETELEIRDSLRGRKMVIICVGLGGGTGSGAAPLITRIAREEGAFVVVFATMPFEFEGKRRRDQAESSLNELAALSNALVTFDNNRMSELVLAKQGIHEAFAAADRMVSESIKAVTRLLVRPGLISIGLDELMTALRTNRSRCLFGSGIAGGENRAQTAVENALNSPLLDRGVLLKGVTNLLVHICGDETLTLYEVELLMQSLKKHTPEDVQVMLGVATDPAMGDKLSVTLISALSEEELLSAESVQRVATDEQPGSAGNEGEDVGERSRDYPEDEPPEDGEIQAKESSSSPVIDFPEDEQIMEPSEGFTDGELPEATHDIEDQADQADEMREVEDLTEVENEAEAQEPVTQRRELDPNFDTIPDFSDSNNPQGSGGFEEDEEQSEKVVMQPPFANTEFAETEFAEDNPGNSGESQTAFTKNSTSQSEREVAQGELELDGGPKGKFEGESPNLLEGEDLDIPPFLRNKRG